MKYLLIILLFAISLKGYSQQAPIRTTSIEATRYMLVPLDTQLNPKRVGEVRYRTQDSTYYVSISITIGQLKWLPSTKLVTFQTTGGGYSVLSPASTPSLIKYRSVTIINGGGDVSATDSTLKLDVTPTVTNITTGTASSISQAKENQIYFNPASAISSYTLALPSGAVSGDRITIKGGGTITSGTLVTTLTLTHASTIIGYTAGTLTVGTPVTLTYNGTNWVK